MFDPKMSPESELTRADLLAALQPGILQQQDRTYFVPAADDHRKTTTAFLALFNPTLITPYRTMHASTA